MPQTLKALLVGIVRESRQRREGGTVGGIGLASQIVKYLQKNYMNQVDYEVLWQEFHMNPIYLNRVFKKYIKTSIHDYILGYRILMAMDMLRWSNASVNEIAQAVGFRDIPHFSKSFKRITGYSPKDYRKST